MRTEALAGHALDLLRLAALAVDRYGKLLYCNVAGAELLREGSTLLRRSNTLTARKGEGKEALRGLLQQALGGARTAAVLSRAGRDAGRVFVLAAPLPGRDGALLFVAEVQNGGDAALVAQLFALTPAEARLALGLACGKTLEEQAAGAGVRLSTVRTQLRHVMAKTGTRRQADVVRLISCLPALREAKGAAPKRQESASMANGAPASARRTTSA